MVRELLIISHEKHGTGVNERKFLMHSEFEITGTAHALRVLGRLFQEV